MVTDLGVAVVGGVFAVLGYSVAGGINIIRSTREQQAENKRLRAQTFAEKEAEALVDLGKQLELTANHYLPYIRSAIRNGVTEEEFEEEISGEYKEFREALAGASIFLSEEGERLMSEFHDSLLQAEQYIRWKASHAEETDYQDGPVDDLWADEERPDSIEFSWPEFKRTYRSGKKSLRNDVTNPVIRLND
ncbi:MAG: hypothetical protein ABEH59_07295 [Halobacteriales archaeon]